MQRRAHEKESKWQPKLRKKERFQRATKTFLYFGDLPEFPIVFFLKGICLDLQRG